MNIGFLIFDGFNEIDSFVSYNIINRITGESLETYLISNSMSITSMNGVEVKAHKTLAFIEKCDAIFIGSGVRTSEVCEDLSVVDDLRKISDRQLIAAQCSGSLILDKLGLLGSNPISTDRKTASKLRTKGFSVSERPISLSGNIATAGGCFASAYLAAWVATRLFGVDQARHALGYIAPAGLEDSFIENIVSLIT